MTPKEQADSLINEFKDLNQNKTLLSFEEYDKQQRIQKLETEIRIKESELNRLKDELQKLK